MRAVAIAVLLALSGATILAIVREQTGTDGFLIGLLLATFPVPLLIAAFRWVGNVEPSPWRTVAFAFAWGACAATLVAIIANGFTAEWLTTSVVPDSDADLVGATVVAPVVEELAKAAAVLLLFLHRRRFLGGVVDGVVTACVTATGFAFTENILYLGTAYADDQLYAGDGFAATTAQTFFVRIVMSPFAHPLFTAMTGIGFGIAAAVSARRRSVRITLPLVGLVTAMVLHALWNGAASSHNGLHFLLVYALFMMPVLATLVWLTVWSRGRDLRTIRETLHAYAAQGWLHPAEPWTLGSMHARSQARSLARRVHGKPAARSVAAYHAAATSLALLRARAERTATPPPDFPARESALLSTLLTHRPQASPPTTTVAPVPPHTLLGPWR
ncbi:MULTISPECIES: PrsW family intramembrane metalloprotease [Streptomyces]|uniref:PrsW family intramembrane metalloprotease n=1 Tax=Streptomyces TaxID=1883 RepID=UPI002B05FA02|nr:PrsW family intramembrane metalloprotease [Streptomyces sp. JHD 1]